MPKLPVDFHPDTHIFSEVTCNMETILAEANLLAAVNPMRRESAPGCNILECTHSIL